MRAIGMLKKGIIRLFCTEGILIGVLGCLLALPFLLLISGILKAANITFVPPVASSEVPLVLLLELQQIASVFGLFCLASLVSSFLVSRKIAHQKVADSLMHMN